MATYAEASTTVTEATSTGGASLACGGGHSIVIDDEKWGEMRKQELFPPELVRYSDVPGDIHQKALCAMSTHLPSLVDYNTLVPQMRGRGLISEDAAWILSSPNTKPSEIVPALLQGLRGPGKLVAERLYLCILDTHESCNDHSELHYDFAVMLKRQLLSVLKISTERQMDHEAQQTCIGHALKMIPDTPLDTEIALQLMETLGVNGDGDDMCIRRQALSVSAICESWHTQKSSATIGSLTQALLSCRGLGKIVSGFFPLYLSNPPAVRRLISRLGKHWTELAVYLGYTDAEISSITCKRGVPVALQIQMFLRVFRMPDLGEKTECILQDALKLAGLQSRLVNSTNTKQTKENPGSVVYNFNNCYISAIPQRQQGMCQLPRYSKSKISLPYPAFQSRHNGESEMEESEDADSLNEERINVQSKEMDGGTRGGRDRARLHRPNRRNSPTKPMLDSEADKQSRRQQHKSKVRRELDSERVEVEHNMITEQETILKLKKPSWGTSSSKDVFVHQQLGISEPPVIRKPPQKRFHTDVFDQITFYTQLDNKLPDTRRIHNEDSPVEEEEKNIPLKQKQQEEERFRSQMFNEAYLNISFILNKMVYKTAYWESGTFNETSIPLSTKAFKDFKVTSTTCFDAVTSFSTLQQFMQLYDAVQIFSAAHSNTLQQLNQLQQEHRRLQNEVSTLRETVQSLQDSIQPESSSQDSIRGHPGRIPLRIRPQFPPIPTCQPTTLGSTSSHMMPVTDTSENCIRRPRSQSTNGDGSQKYGLYLYSPTNRISPQQLCVVIIALCASPEHGTPKQSAEQLKQKIGTEYRHHHFQMKEIWPVRFVDVKAEFKANIVSPADFEVESMGLTEITQEEADLRDEDDNPAYIVYYVLHNQDNAIQQLVRIRFRVVGLDRPAELNPVLIIGSSDNPPAPHRSPLQQLETVTNMIVQHLHHIWYLLGIELGLHRSLATIRTQSTSDDDCCRSVIEMWMNSGIPSDNNIRDLVAAVRNIDENFAETLDQQLRDTHT